MKKHYKKVLKITEETVRWIINYQITDPESENYGAYVDPATGYGEPAVWGSGICADILITVYYNKDSIYFKNEGILERARIALSFLANNQNGDGTMDQKGSNYHCTAAAAFCVETMAKTYALMNRYNMGEKLEIEMLKTMYDVIEKAGFAMLNGGFHTPNHRWAISEALALAYKITKHTEFLSMIDRYLAEGIDMNSDGSYTEKSVGVYDAIVDLAFITLSEELNRPEYISYVTKNLDMIVKYIQPDGSIFTGQSSRQDRGVKIYPIHFYSAFLIMAHKTGNPMYAFVAEEIYNCHLSSINKNGPYKNFLSLFMLRDELREYQPENMESYSTNYEHWFKDTGVVRIRQENKSITMVEKNPNFLEYQIGTTRMQVRLCASFFARGQFKAQKIEKVQDGYKLIFDVQYGYIRPFENGSDTNDWLKMNHGDWSYIERFNTPGLYPLWETIDHGTRDTVNVVTMGIDLNIKEVSGELEILINSRGKEGIPFKLEFVLDAGGILDSPGATIKTKKGNEIIVKEGMCVYKNGMDLLSFGPGFSKHNFTDNMRGALLQDKEAFTVYFTGFTPINKNIKISSN